VSPGRLWPGWQAGRVPCWIERPHTSRTVSSRNKANPYRRGNTQWLSDVFSCKATWAVQLAKYDGLLRSNFLCLGMQFSLGVEQRCSMTCWTCDRCCLGWKLCAALGVPRFVSCCQPISFGRCFRVMCLSCLFRNSCRRLHVGTCWRRFLSALLLRPLCHNLPYCLERTLPVRAKVSPRRRLKCDLFCAHGAGRRNGIAAYVLVCSACTAFGNFVFFLATEDWFGLPGLP
jgi:hypothetical protein